MPGVYVRAVRAGDLLELRDYDSEDKRLCRLIELAIVDAEGRRMIEDGGSGDLDLPLFLRLSAVANAQNALDADAVEDAEKN